MSASANSQLLFHDLLGDHQFQYSRRLLFLHSHLNSSTNPSSSNNSAESSFLGDGNFDANVIMVLSVLLCALICSLGLNSIIRCALRCSNVVVLNNNDLNTTNPPARLASTGVKKKALKTFPTVTYSSELKLPGLDPECAICLSEFNNGDRLRILPKCNHGFHVRCIDKWLSSHSSCPKCRHCLIQTCHKIIGSETTTSQPSSAASAETIVRIAPLEPEGMVRNNDA
ncbi:RING-H2 finger protein ATL78-like [Neltuma alba]|uniref:RING-H2 finger protein ATL78-like n=1 Tax=Neltuma alba TaxID=207710 RepID=UPI0010A309BC|nr:RING-H2 finger protein ATL78-like [Prosopis alba]XP_028798772.1 RING-H2 finger protein ATL78-like [Prosopis alba]